MVRQAEDGSLPEVELGLPRPRIIHDLVLDPVRLEAQTTVEDVEDGRTGALDEAIIVHWVLVHVADGHQHDHGVLVGGSGRGIETGRDVDIKRGLGRESVLAKDLVKAGLIGLGQEDVVDVEGGDRSGHGPVERDGGAGELFGGQALGRPGTGREQLVVGIDQIRITDDGIGLDDLPVGQRHAGHATALGVDLGHRCVVDKARAEFLLSDLFEPVDDLVEAAARVPDALDAFGVLQQAVHGWGIIRRHPKDGSVLPVRCSIDLPHVHRLKRKGHPHLFRLEIPRGPSIDRVQQMQSPDLGPIPNQIPDTLKIALDRDRRPACVMDLGLLQETEEAIHAAWALDPVHHLLHPTEVRRELDRVSVWEMQPVVVFTPQQVHMVPNPFVQVRKGLLKHLGHQVQRRALVESKAVVSQGRTPPPREPILLDHRHSKALTGQSGCCRCAAHTCPNDHHMFPFVHQK